MLVETAHERDEQIPALLYESMVYLMADFVGGSGNASLSEENNSSETQPAPESMEIETNPAHVSDPTLNLPHGLENSLISENSQPQMQDLTPNASSKVKGIGNQMGEELPELNHELSDSDPDPDQESASSLPQETRRKPNPSRLAHVASREAEDHPEIYTIEETVDESTLKLLYI